jgi:hypothetical protein
MSPILLSFEQQLDIQFALDTDEPEVLDADAAAYYMYFKFGGEIPSGKILARTCDEPQCVNPDHMVVINRE